MNLELAEDAFRRIRGHRRRGGAAQPLTKFVVGEVAPDRVSERGGVFAPLTHRESMLDRLARADSRRVDASSPPAALSLGSIGEVRGRLPLAVEFGGHSFRIVDIDGELVAHSTVCPHWLGPLDQAPLVDGCVTCPWHGYRFDVRSGASADGHALTLRRGPVVAIDTEADRVTLIAPSAA